MKRNSQATALALSLLSLPACIDGESSAYAGFGNDGWLYTDTVALAPDSAAVSADSIAPPADIALAVRHTNGYEYSNLWVELTYCRRGEEECRRDSFNIILADDPGRWKGSGIGVDYQRVDTLLHSIPLDRLRPVTVRHIMRSDTLAAIQQVGIIISNK